MQTREAPTAASTLLLLFVLVGRPCVPVEEDLGSDEAIAEGGDHKDASHEGVSGFLVVRDSQGHSCLM